MSWLERALADGCPNRACQRTGKHEGDCVTIPDIRQMIEAIEFMKKQLGSGLLDYSTLNRILSSVDRL